jgi:hypothetical protein
MKIFSPGLSLKLSLIVFNVICFLSVSLHAQTVPPGHLAPKPVYSDPVYNGAADPCIVWNKKAKKWWMFYTNRRAADKNAVGVTWVHGTRIGIAESADGANWKYVDTANINYRPTAEYTHWAPEIIEYKGLYHMYLTYVPGIFTDWHHPRNIIHLTSTDLRNWKYQSTLKLATDKVIDPDVYAMPDGSWRMWYNNESDHKSIYYADSKDLYTWTDKGKAIRDMPGEGPVVFNFKGHTWMIVDNWKGMGVYQSSDMLNWKRQEERLVELPGTGKDDQAIGGHADVVVKGDHAYLYYFTHPGRSKLNPAPADSFEARRSVIQVAELHYIDGKLTCDRDQPVYVNLK